ncbi:UPF0182 family protein, partial [Planktothrix sp.]|uniref:UPF0182 family protein n=1 Tax=Planktothrix sp. TaxID=3088171 RepID=UPI0038D4B7CC
MTKNQVFKIGLGILGLGFILDLSAKFMAEFFWFEEVGYLSVFKQRLITEIALAVLGLCITAVWLGGNLVIAQRYQYLPEDLRGKPPVNIFDIS